MFTGIIEEIGTVRRIEHGAKGARLTIQAKTVLEDTRIGDSIATNGVCLTVVSMTGDSFSADVMAESLRRSSLGTLQGGSPVNLERAMAANGRFGGHIVSGHIDAAAPVLDYRKMPDGDFELRVALPELLAPELVEKGSIAIDGVSLTVIEVGGDFFTVRLIPVTRSDTALVERTPGSLVNLEGDVIGKYVRRQFELRSGRAPEPKSDITMDTLREAGFL